MDSEFIQVVAKIRLQYIVQECRQLVRGHVYIGGHILNTISLFEERFFLSHKLVEACAEKFDLAAAEMFLYFFFPVLTTPQVSEDVKKSFFHIACF